LHLGGQEVKSNCGQSEVSKSSMNVPLTAINSRSLAHTSTIGICNLYYWKMSWEEKTRGEGKRKGSVDWITFNAEEYPVVNEYTHIYIYSIVVATQ